MELCKKSKFEHHTCHQLKTFYCFDCLDEDDELVQCGWHSSIMLLSTASTMGICLTITRCVVMACRKLPLIRS